MTCHGLHNMGLPLSAGHSVGQVRGMGVSIIVFSTVFEINRKSSSGPRHKSERVAWEEGGERGGVRVAVWGVAVGRKG